MDEDSRAARFEAETGFTRNPRPGGLFIVAFAVMK
jgi:hypothetical protein